MKQNNETTNSDSTYLSKANVRGNFFLIILLYLFLRYDTLSCLIYCHSQGNGDMRFVRIKRNKNKSIHQTIIHEHTALLFYKL